MLIDFRIKLILSIIEAKRYDGGCGLHLQELLVRGALLAAFPIHDFFELESVERQWLVLYAWPWTQPLGQK